MAKVTFGPQGELITYMDALPRVCCKSFTDEPHQPWCRNNPKRIDKRLFRRHR